MAQPKSVCLWRRLRVIPCLRAASFSPATTRTQPTPAAWVAGSPELSRLGGLRPLAAPGHGPAPRGGARACNPRCVRIFSITDGSRIAAMILSSPPQFGQCCRSSSNTRLSSRAHLMRPNRIWAIAMDGGCSLGGRLRVLRRSISSLHCRPHSPHHQRQLWSRQIAMPNVSTQSGADGQLFPKLTFRFKVCNGTGCTSAMQRLRVLASGSFPDVRFCRLSCQSAVIRGGRQRARSCPLKRQNERQRCPRR
jgi:hypothetical protein